MKAEATGGQGRNLKLLLLLIDRVMVETEDNVSYLCWGLTLMSVSMESPPLELDWGIRYS